ncbi:MAG TPA: MFS transporter [Bryobacteraceae bacterium]|nr:MFS transporter [Bryobacteraceae bacterium]
MSSTAAPSQVQRASFMAQSKLIALLFALSGMSYFDRVALSIAGPDIMKEFQLSEVHMGYIYSAFLLSYTILMTPGGRLADRFGGRLVLLVSGLGAGLFTGLTALCGPSGLGAYFGTVPAFLLIRIAFGASSAPLYPSCGRLIAAWIPPRQQARALSIVVSAASIGAAAAPLAFSWLIGAFGWRICFWFAAVLTVLLISICYVWLQEPLPGHQLPSLAAGHTTASAWRLLLMNRHLLLITSSYFALNYFQYIFYYWIYYYFGEIRKLGKDQTTFATTVLFISMAIMTPIGGILSDGAVRRLGLKNGKRVVPIIAMIFSAVLLYAGAGGWGMAATVTLLALAVGCATAPEGAFWSTAIHVGQPHVGAASAIMNCGGNVGGMLAPILTPLIATRFGWSGGLYFASALVMAGMLAWFFIDPTKSAGGMPADDPGYL